MWTFIRFSLALCVLIVFGSCAMFLSNHSYLWAVNVVGQNHLQRLGWVVGILEALPGINRAEGISSTTNLTAFETAAAIRAVVDQVGSRSGFPFTLRALGAIHADQPLGCPDPSSDNCSVSEGLRTILNNGLIATANDDDGEGGGTISSIYEDDSEEEGGTLVATSYSPSLQVAFELTLDPRRYYAVLTASWGSAVTAGGFMCLALVLWQITLSSVGSLQNKGIGAGLLGGASLLSIILFVVMFAVCRSVDNELLREAMAADNEATCSFLDDVLSAIPAHIDEDLFLQQLSATMDAANSQTELFFDDIKLYRSTQKLYLRTLTGQSTQVVPEALVSTLDLATATPTTHKFISSDSFELRTVMVSAQLGDGSVLLLQTEGEDTPMLGSSATQGIFAFGLVLTIVLCILYSAASMKALMMAKNPEEDDVEDDDAVPEVMPNSGPSNQIIAILTISSIFIVMVVVGIPLLAISQHGANFVKEQQLGFNGAGVVLQRQLSGSSALLDVATSLVLRTDVSESESEALVALGSSSPLTSEAMEEISTFYTSLHAIQGTASASKKDMLDLFRSEILDGSAPQLVTTEIDAVLTELRATSNISTLKVEQLSTAMHELALVFARLVSTSNLTFFEIEDTKQRAYVTGNLSDLSADVPVAVAVLTAYMASFIVPTYSSLAATITATEAGTVAAETLYGTDGATSALARESEVQSNLTGLLSAELSTTGGQMSLSYVTLLQLVIVKASTWAYISVAVLAVSVAVWVFTQSAAGRRTTKNSSGEIIYHKRFIVTGTTVIVVVTVACLVGVQLSAKRSMDTFEGITQDELSNRRVLLIRRAHVRASEALRLLANAVVSSEATIGLSSQEGAANLTAGIVALRSLLSTDQLGNLTLLDYELDQFSEQLNVAAMNWSMGVTLPYHPPSELAVVLEEHLEGMRAEVISCNHSEYGGTLAVGNFSKHWVLALRETLGYGEASMEAQLDLAEHLNRTVDACQGSSTAHIEQGMEVLFQVMTLRSEASTFIELTTTDVYSLITQFRNQVEPLFERSILEASLKKYQVSVQNRDAKAVFWLPIVVIWLLIGLVGLSWVSSVRDLVELGSEREGRQY